MQHKLCRFFIISAGWLLLITSIAKLISAFGHAEALLTKDPLLNLAFKDLFLLAGSVELITALFCLMGNRILAQSSVVLWLATNIGLYRFGLWLVHYHKPCSCLAAIFHHRGNLSFGQARKDEKLRVKV